MVEVTLFDTESGMEIGTFDMPMPAAGDVLAEDGFKVDSVIPNTEGDEAKVWGIW